MAVEASDVSNKTKKKSTKEKVKAAAAEPDAAPTAAARGKKRKQAPGGQPAAPSAAGSSARASAQPVARAATEATVDGDATPRKQKRRRCDIALEEWPVNMRESGAKACRASGRNTLVLLHRTKKQREESAAEATPEELARRAYQKQRQV